MFLDKIRKDQMGLVLIIGWAMDFFKGKESLETNSTCIYLHNFLVYTRNF
jgi:hypothetical protein